MTASLLVFGGAHIDRRGRITGATTMAASNPGTWFEEAGGGAFNAARALSRLGHRVTMISPRGGDAAGETVAAAALAAGIDDRPVVFLDRATPSYTAILDSDGELLIALADMELYRLFSPRRFRIRAVREALDAATHVLCDANLPAETLDALAASVAARGLHLSAIGISPAKVLRLQGTLDQMSCLFINEKEAEVLAGGRPSVPEAWPDLLRPTGLRSAVITHGSRPLIAYDGERRYRLSLPAVEEVADVTGAGDAMAGGTLAGLANGHPLPAAIRIGAVAARLTIQCPTATAEDLTLERLTSLLPLLPETEVLP